jgi:hypothetical protein
MVQKKQENNYNKPLNEHRIIRVQLYNSREAALPKKSSPDDISQTQRGLYAAAPYQHNLSQPEALEHCCAT